MTFSAPDPRSGSSLPAGRRWHAASRWVPGLLLSLLAAAGGATGLRAQQPAAASSPRAEFTASFRPVAAAGKATRAVPAEVSRETLTAGEEAEPLQVEVSLRMRHFDELQRRVAAGEVISREEMAARFLPDEREYRAVSRWLAAQGLTVEEAGAGHALVAASGTPAQMRRTFQTRVARVRFHGEEYTAALDAPSLPVEIQAQVRSIHGLQPYLHPHKRGAIHKDSLTASGQPPFTVNEIRAAYNITNTGLTGAGEQIGIVIDNPPLSTDLTQFWSANNVAQTLDNIITVNVRNRTLPAPSGEETLDVSWSSGLAPAAKVVIYACASLNYVNSSYSRILDDLQSNARPGLHQVSMSFDGGEQEDETPDDINSVHEMFTAMAAYGVSLFAASGDDGAYIDADKVVQVGYPASDPLVTGVGGTNLTLHYGSNAIQSETAWSPDGSGADDSSGGGISKFFARPSWQVGEGVPSGTKRLVPDVAFDGDPATGGYLVFRGRVKQYGGTSWGSPCWAALSALLNQSRAAKGAAPLGSLNPALYPLLGTTSFHDITTGDNGVYDAGTGYDLVTGLGTPDFTVLARTLTPVSSVPAPVLTSSGVASAVAGANFAYVITATNSPTSFAATNLPTGLNFDSTRGLIAGQVATAGTYVIGISASNAGGTSAASFTLTVTDTPPPVPVPALILKPFVPQAIYTAGQNGEFAVYLTEPTTVDLTVNYTLEGNAVNGTDYEELPGVLTIPAGESYGLIEVVPTGSLKGQATRNLWLLLNPGDNYTVRTLKARKVVISRR